MKFKTGLLIGLAVGYYYGTKAGRERYEQIDDALERIRRSAAYRRLRETADDLLEEGRERALGVLDGIVDNPDTSSRTPTTAAFDAYIDPTLN